MNYEEMLRNLAASGKGNQTVSIASAPSANPEVRDNFGDDNQIVSIANTPVPAKAPDGFGQFSKDKPEEEKTVEDYVAEFEKYAALQDQVAARTAGVDPRGRTSRAQRALKNIFSASSAYDGNSTEGREKGAQSAQDDIFTLLDPTAWIQDKTSIADPGNYDEELSYEKYPNLKVGDNVSTKDGKLWKFTGTRKDLNFDPKTMNQQEYFLRNRLSTFRST